MSAKNMYSLLLRRVRVSQLFSCKLESDEGAATSMWLLKYVQGKTVIIVAVEDNGFNRCG